MRLFILTMCCVVLSVLAATFVAEGIQWLLTRADEGRRG